MTKFTPTIFLACDIWRMDFIGPVARAVRERGRLVTKGLHCSRGYRGGAISPPKVLHRDSATRPSRSFRIEGRNIWREINERERVVTAPASVSGTPIVFSSACMSDSGYGQSSLLGWTKGQTQIVDAEIDRDSVSENIFVSPRRHHSQNLDQWSKTGLPRWGG